MKCARRQIAPQFTVAEQVRPHQVDEKAREILAREIRAQPTVNMTDLGNRPEKETARMNTH